MFALPYGRATDKCVLNVCRAPAANFHKVVIMVCKLEFRCLNFKFYWFHILLFMLQRSVEHLTVIYSVRNWYQQSAKFLETVLRFNRTRSLPLFMHCVREPCRKAEKTKQRTSYNRHCSHHNSQDLCPVDYNVIWSMLNWCVYLSTMYNVYWGSGKTLITVLLFARLNNSVQGCMCVWVQRVHGHFAQNV